MAQDARLQKAHELAERAEQILNTANGTEALEQCINELHREMQSIQEADGVDKIVQSSTYKALEQRLSACKRRIGIIKMSMMETQEKQRDSTRHCERVQANTRHEPEDYYTRNNTKLHDYIKITSHSVHAIEKQKRMLKDGRRKLEESLEYLGLSDRTINMISSRYLTDYNIFKGLVALFVILFIYVFMIRSGNK